MKKIIFLFVIFLIIISCDKDDVNYINSYTYISGENQNNSNNDSLFAETQFLKQIGPVTYDLNENRIKIPLHTNGIYSDMHRADIVIFQNGQKLPGVFILEKNNGIFFTRGFYPINGVELIPNSTILIEMYASVTSSTRKFVDRITLQ